MNAGGLEGMRHWRLATDAQGIAWATLDCAGSSTNTLAAEVLGELGELLDRLERQPPRGLIFTSAKAAGFIAGADIDEFSAVSDFAGARALIGRGWQLFERLERLPFPTLALIRGHCLGGGLELALACRYRVVVDVPETRLALPEVLLGIVPGWGGMKRLPRLIGPQAALDLMLSGKGVDARKASRLGLADLCVPPRLMRRSAAEYLLAGQQPRHPTLSQQLFNGPLKSVIAAGARRAVATKAQREHYPAPWAIIDLWARHDGNALAAPALLESIVASPTARNLIRVFRLQERLKAFGKDGAAPPQRVHVVGAGVMGGDIAAWCALRGLTVSLQDVSIERIAPAMARAAKLFERRLKQPLAVRAALDRLIPDPAGVGIAHADVVIEAIVEDLAAKRDLFARIEAQARPDALLATNTSSLRLEDLQPALRQPPRLVGIHFFNPVAMMPLVEVIAAAGADTAIVDRACAFVRRLDKLPLPVKSAPGFLVNAVLAPYLHEAMRCVDEGIAVATIDAAMVRFGMPTGPLALADTVGLDIVLNAGRHLLGNIGEPPRCLRERVDHGDLGRKTGRGFYDYGGGEPAKASLSALPAGLAERLVAPMLHRTRQLVEEGVVADADLADAGVIFGTGFAPFTGGPMNFQRSLHA